jgi:hypothetical protein
MKCPSCGSDNREGFASARLEYDFTDDEDLWNMVCRDVAEPNGMMLLRLRSVPQSLGGRRLWFVCPLTAKLVPRLYAPPGSNEFASRHAHRLGYRSQRQPAV